MTFEEAREVYTDPRGYSKSVLIDCIHTLNANAQPVELNSLQFEAMLDAHRRLGIALEVGND